MEARKIAVAERTPASRKLHAEDASELLKDISSLIVMKGKKVSEFNTKTALTEDAVAAMLGPTGNLRAPTIRIGKTLLVGFNEDIFARECG